MPNIIQIQCTIFGTALLKPCDCWDTVFRSNQHSILSRTMKTYHQPSTRFARSIFFVIIAQRLTQRLQQSQKLLRGHRVTPAFGNLPSWNGDSHHPTTCTQLSYEHLKQKKHIAVTQLDNFLLNNHLWTKKNSTYCKQNPSIQNFVQLFHTLLKYNVPQG